MSEFEKCYRIPLAHQILMCFRRSPVREIKEQLARCAEAGLAMNPDFLEAHALAGGNLEELVDGLLFMKECQMRGDLYEVAARELLSSHGGAPRLKEQLEDLRAKGVLVLDSQSQ